MDFVALAILTNGHGVGMSMGWLQHCEFHGMLTHFSGDLPTAIIPSFVTLSSVIQRQVALCLRALSLPPPAFRCNAMPWPGSRSPPQAKVISVPPDRSYDPAGGPLANLS